MCEGVGRGAGGVRRGEAETSELREGTREGGLVKWENEVEGEFPLDRGAEGYGERVRHQASVAWCSVERKTMMAWWGTLSERRQSVRGVFDEGLEMDPRDRYVALE